ncbi:MAG: glycosyltransferase, partial [Sphingobacteriales bacterium]
MNILQITSRIPFPLNDGGNIATYFVTDYLKKLGHKVTLAALNTKKHHQKPEVLSDIAQVFATDIDTTVTIPGLIKGFFGELPYIVSRFWSTEFEQQLAHILQQKTFDIIQLEGVYMAIYLPVLRKFSKAKIVLRAHNVEHQIWQRLSENEPALHKRLYMRYLANKVRRFEEEYACKFDGIIAITETDAAWFKKQCATTQITSISAGVHLAKPEQISLEKLKPTVAILGSLEWAPNVQGLEWFLA